MSPTTIRFFLALKLLLLTMVAWSSMGHCSTTPRPKSIGAVLDLDSLMGKQQKVAIKIAIRDFNRFSRTNKLHLKMKNSRGNSAQTVASGLGSFSQFSDPAWSSTFASLMNMLIMLAGPKLGGYAQEESEIYSLISDHGLAPHNIF
ncbi:hypothetical protein PIB30_032432 [Stylosanthes scabra]|uniref:Uncharacterized protein n=1 Tax=Stylosanthes scabra TaxID=79078 RepID=A0ABU6ZAW1_9FABA|nr:hypothetical protein [Stylosanthes scabra]